KAMEQMKQLSGGNEASRSMITFLALNTSSLTLIPTTVIAIRLEYNSLAPTEIVGTTIIATLISSISAVLIDRLFYYKNVLRKSIMGIVTTLSTWLIPCFILIVLAIATWKQVPAYELFVEGGKEGFKMAFSLLPFLVGMIVSISILRSSGALEAFVN